MDDRLEAEFPIANAKPVLEWHDAEVGNPVPIERHQSPPGRSHDLHVGKSAAVTSALRILPRHKAAQSGRRIAYRRCSGSGQKMLKSPRLQHQYAHQLNLSTALSVSAYRH
jgi:hypothetical protein